MRGSTISRGRSDGSVLFCDDTASDPETAYKGFEKLIAVGMQAGKVSIYNMLWLLMHEIVTDKPIRSVQWIGDMSAPVTLPQRKSLLSPDPSPVI